MQMAAGAAASCGSSASWRPGRGIATDVRHRVLPFYRDDWIQGLNWGTRIFAPATYIFFASVLPALAFGQQLATDTDGTLNVVHVLVATALAGLVQSFAGGQPLLIIGVAEPIVIIYGFMYSFAKSTPGLGAPLFLPWAAWVCVWTALLCCVLAVLGACEGIHLFTRFSGELFGALIAILFLQVGIKGIVHEFYPLELSSTQQTQQQQWQLTLINGLWSLLLSLALLLSCLKIRTARSWLLGRGWLRGFLADYGVPLLVVVWSAVSFAVTPAAAVPRRVATPNTWQVQDTWSVAGRMQQVPGAYIAAALVPAIIITVLFYFDHNVSSQLAQQPEFNLVKGSAYHWDFLLLSALTLVCGLIGIPPVNGVLPQAPMHTRSLAHIRKRKLPFNAIETVAPAAGPADGNTAVDSSNSNDTELEVAGVFAVSTPKCTAMAPGPANMTVLTAAAADALSLPGQEYGRENELWHVGALHNAEASVSEVTQAMSELQLCQQKHKHKQLPGPQSAMAAAVSEVAASMSELQLDPCQSGLQQQQQQQLAMAASVTQPAYSSSSSRALRHRSQHTSPQGRGPQSPLDSPAAQQQHQLHHTTASSSHHMPSHHQQQHRGRKLHPTGSDVALNTMPDSADGTDNRKEVSSMADPSQEGQDEQHGYCLRLEVREQRVSNLLQSLLVAACLGITPAIQLIPTGVLWGYFIFMAIESLSGSQLWERVLLLATDPKKRVTVMQQEHAAYLQLVPFKVVVRFTLLQVVYLLGVWALTTWAGIAGVAFPIPIMALVPLRQFVLPRLFDRGHLAQLDAASYEEAPPVPDRLQAAQELFALGAIAESPAPHLPVTSTSPQAGVGSSGVLDEDEAEILSQEFQGLQLKHHLTRESLKNYQHQHWDQ